MAAISDRAQLPMITLKDGSRVPAPRFRTITGDLDDLLLTSPKTFFALFKKCVTANFELTPFDKETLQQRCLIDETEKPDKDIRNIVINSVIRNENSLKIVDPIMKA